MHFHDYAATEASTLIARLLATQSDDCRHQLLAVRAALDAAAQALETAPPIDQDVQALVAKLTAAVEAESQKAAEEVRRVAEDGRRRLDEASGALAAQVEENNRLASVVARVEAEAALLKSELATAQERADSVERDLSATVDAHAELERMLDATDAELRQALQGRAQADAELTSVRATMQHAGSEAEQLRHQLHRVTAEGVQLREMLERTTVEGHELGEALARATADAHGLRDALDRSTAEGRELRQALEQASSQTGLLEARAGQLQQEIEVYQAERSELDRRLAAAEDSGAGRDGLVRELDAATARVKTIEGELATMSEIAASELDAATARVAAVEAALAEAQRAVVDHDTVVTELGVSRARTVTLEAQQADHDEQIRQLQVRLDEALQAEAKLRESVARGSGDIRPDEEQTETLRWELERMVSLFDASVRAVNEMTKARSSGELLTELVKRLSIQFTRVALFRVKSHGLEAEQHIGFEDTEIGKLVLPVTMDSLLTRAIDSGAVESLTGADISSKLGTPFGGSPTSAVALPIVLQGTTLAVVYADDADMPDYARGPAIHESSVGFAKLLVDEAAVLLMCHTQELKTLAELRQYATTLLQEAKEMYVADTEAGKPAAQLRVRLKDNLDCASQLYTYRAAMEGTAAAALLDEQIAVEMAGSSPFSRDLAEVVHSMSATDLGMTAEAS
jgi:predicted nuclease with TOPRIM domain